MRSLSIVGRRLAASVPTLLLVSLGAYLLLEAAPGDAADAYLAQTGGDAGFAAGLRQRLGLLLGGLPVDERGEGPACLEGMALKLLGRQGPQVGEVKLRPGVRR